MNSLCLFRIFQGQTESKKISKRGGVPETKGTAMSFGFKKKLLPSNKKNANKNGAKEKETETMAQQTATVYSNPNCLEAELEGNGDDNGNTGMIWGHFPESNFPWKKI